MLLPFRDETLWIVSFDATEDADVGRSLVLTLLLCVPLVGLMVDGGISKGLSRTPSPFIRFAPEVAQAAFAARGPVGGERIDPTGREDGVDSDDGPCSVASCSTKEKRFDDAGKERPVARVLSP